MYLIKHYYDVDGGFGDSVGTEKTIGFVSTEEEAKEYCKQWSHPCVYARPYASLHCGKLGYEKSK